VQISKASDNSTSLQAGRDNILTINNNNGLSISDIESFFNILIESKMSKITTEVGKRLNENLNSILFRAKTILEEKELTKNKISLRSLKNIVNDGMFCDETICQEYYAGVMAASFGEATDAGLYYTNLISRLTSTALKLHYYLYSSSLYHYNNTKERGSSVSRFLIDEDDLYNLFGGVFNINTFEIREALSNLKSENLLHGYGIEKKEIIKKEYRIEVDVDCFMFQQTERGVFFYLWANGLSNTEWDTAKQKCNLFPDHLGFSVPKFCKDVINIGDAYLLAENKIRTQSLTSVSTTDAVTARDL
jgi:hypothetical protein